MPSARGWRLAAVSPVNGQCSGRHSARAVVGGVVRGRLPARSATTSPAESAAKTRPPEAIRSRSASFSTRTWLSRERSASTWVSSSMIRWMPARLTPSDESFCTSRRRSTSREE